MLCVTLERDSFQISRSKRIRMGPFEHMHAWFCLEPRLLLSLYITPVLWIAQTKTQRVYMCFIICDYELTILCWLVAPIILWLLAFEKGKDFWLLVVCLLIIGVALTLVPCLSLVSFLWGLLKLSSLKRI